VGPPDFLVPVSVSSRVRAQRVRARCRFSIKTLGSATSAQRASFRKLAKIGQIIFSGSSRKRCTGTTRILYGARKQAESRAFSIHGRDAVGLAGDFMRVCGIRWRKAACHGRLRARRAQDRNLSTVSWKRPDRARNSPPENAYSVLAAVVTLTGRSLTLWGADAIEVRFSGASCGPEASREVRRKP